MKNTIKFRVPSARQVALWGLVVALVLVLALVGAGRGNEGAEAQSPIPGLQSPASSRTITYAYDSAGRLTTANYGDGAIIAYTYDASGNLIGVSPGGYNVYLPLVLRQSP